MSWRGRMKVDVRNRARSISYRKRNEENPLPLVKHSIGQYDSGDEGDISDDGGYQGSVRRMVPTRLRHKRSNDLTTSTSTAAPTSSSFDSDSDSDDDTTSQVGPVSSTAATAPGATLASEPSSLSSQASVSVTMSDSDSDDETSTISLSQTTALPSAAPLPIPAAATPVPGISRVRFRRWSWHWLITAAASSSSSITAAVPQLASMPAPTPVAQSLTPVILTSKSKSDYMTTSTSQGRLSLACTTKTVLIVARCNIRGDHQRNKFCSIVNNTPEFRRNCQQPVKPGNASGD